MVNPMTYVLSPLRGNINPEYPKGLHIYLRETREIEKHSDKLDTTVSNTNAIV